jgi:hypothetical protein
MAIVDLPEEAIADVGDVKSCTTEYVRERQSRLISERAVREKNQEILKLQREKAALLGDAKNRAKFFDKRLLHPVISLPPVAWAIATMLAVLIMIDRRTGWARRPNLSLKFAADKGTDIWAAPSEVNAAGVGDCAKFVRQTGAFFGDEVGCAKIPGGGWHVWLRAAGKIIDPCVNRGMGPVPPSVYANGTYVPIPREAMARPRFQANLESSELEAIEQLDELQLAEPPPWPTLDFDEEVSGIELENVENEDVGEVFAEGEVAGLPAIIDETNQHEVSGTATTVATGIQIVGAVGSLVAAAYGGPAAAVAVNGVATLAASEVAKLDQQTKKKNTKPDTAQLHKAALAAAARATGEERKAALAVAAVTSDKPHVRKMVWTRLMVPRKDDKNQTDRARIEAALVTLKELGYGVRLDKNETPAPEPGATEDEANQQGVGLWQDIGLWHEMTEPDCPGTCGVAR